MKNHHEGNEVRTMKTKIPGKLILTLLTLVMVVVLSLALAVALPSAGVQAADDENVTVTFSAGLYEGLSYVKPPEPQTFAAGGKAVEPGEDDLRIGVVARYSDAYYLDGWYTDKACTELFDFDTPVTEDITLYAGYTTIPGKNCEEWFDGVLFSFYTTPEMYERNNNEDLKAYYPHYGGYCEWNNITIKDFSMIEGLDYDPENHVLTFNNYNGPAISIDNKSRQYDEYENFEDMEIRFLGTNNIYLTHNIGGLHFHRTNVTFTGDGTVNLDYTGFYYMEREGNPTLSVNRLYFTWLSTQVVWDGPTLNIMGMTGEGINQMEHSTGGQGYKDFHFKMLNGEINVDIIPVSRFETEDTSTGRDLDPIVCIGNSFDLIGGTFHVHYRKAREDDTFADAYKFRYNNEMQDISDVKYVTGTWPVLGGPYGSETKVALMDREVYISPDFDFQIEVDEDLQELGFNAIPFIVEDFDFRFLLPDLPTGVTPPYSITDWSRSVDSSTTDFSDIDGLSYNFDNYTDLPNSHTLVMNNYSGPGLRIRSMLYPGTALNIEVQGNNTIYCNGLSGLWLDDVNVTFTGDGTLRFVGMEPEQDAILNYTGSDETYVSVPQRGCSAIIFCNNSNGYGYDPQAPASVTVDGPNIIVDGYYRYGAFLDLKDVTVKSGSVEMTSPHASMRSSVSGDTTDRSKFSYQSMFWLGDTWQDEPCSLHLNGGTTIINFDPSPKSVPGSYAYLDFGIRLLFVSGDVNVEDGALTLVGEDEILRQTLYIGNTMALKDLVPFTQHVRKVQTLEVEHGHALVRVEGGQVIVTAEPEEAYKLKSISCRVGSGTPFSLLDADGDGKIEFPLPEGTDDVNITPEFWPADEIGVTFAGYSVSLEGNIGVNFYMSLTDEVLAHKDTAYMKFTIPNGTTSTEKIVYVKDATIEEVRGKTYYVFKCGVSAKDMNSEIKAQIIDGESVGAEYTYTVVDYANYIIDHADYDPDFAKALPLVKALLNYGARAQSYFGIEADPANTHLDEADQSLGDVEIPAPREYTENLPEGVVFEGATLSLKTETTLSLYFSSENVPVFSSDTLTVEYAKVGNYHVARIRGISAKNLDKLLTIDVTCGGNTGSISYSALHYCYNVQQGEYDDKLKEVVEALYLFHEAAVAYSQN